MLIIDFGSQYTQLIARCIRELKVYAEIKPCYISFEEFQEINPKAVIFSGGPASIYKKDAPTINSKIFEYIIENQIPLLGICYGLQFITHALGGRVEPSHKREFGFAELHIKPESSPFTKGISSHTAVWMSHGDKITALPPGFESLASTSSSEFAMISHKGLKKGLKEGLKNDSKKNLNKLEKGHKVYGVQFHPEVHHTQQGKYIFKKFL